MVSDQILEVNNITKRFGGLVAVNDVTLSIKKGSVIGLVGPNGSGKTTLFNVISGVYRPEVGEIYFDDKRIDNLSPDDIYRMGLVRTFQIPRLFLKLTVLDNVLLAARENEGEGFFNVFTGRPKWFKQETDLAKKALSILKLFELGGTAIVPANELSGGQMKLLEIARALMSEPYMLLLDEPTAGVHPVLAEKIFEKLTELRDQLGLTLFIIEHRIDLLLNYVQRIYVMHRGRIIVQGKPEEIMNDEAVAKIYMGEE